MNQGFNGSNAYNALVLRELGYGFGTKPKLMKREYSQFLNNFDYRKEFDFIYKLFVARFKWDVSSLNMSNQYPEQKLFFNRFLCFFKDHSYGWLLLPATPIGWNVYLEPSRLLVQGYDFQREINYSRDSEEAVLLYDNVAFQAPFVDFQRYASLLSDVGRTCEVYTNSLKKPIEIITDFSGKKSAETIIDNITQNDSYILHDIKNFPKDEMGNSIISQLKRDINANDLKGIDMYKHSLFDEMLGRLGITTTPMRKQAQQSEDEINKGDDMCRLVLSQATECREEAVKKMVEISGKEITCEVVDDISGDSWETNDKGVIKE